MTGTKTWIAALISIVTGLGMLLTAGLALMNGEAAPEGTSISAGIGFISAGIGMIGIGHKVEKGAETIAEATAKAAQSSG